MRAHTQASKKTVQGASRLWWKRFVEKESFEPVMKQRMCVMEVESGEQV